MLYWLRDGSISWGITLLKMVMVCPREIGVYQHWMICYNKSSTEPRWSTMERRLLYFCENDPSIGLRVRRSTAGPEGYLLDCFIKKKSLDKRNKSDLAMFVEPEILSGYPDLVIAKYDVSKHRGWNDKRLKLRNIDIRILYYFLVRNHATSSQCCMQLGIKKAILLDCLENLLDAKLIMRKHFEWFVSEGFADSLLISELISVEAKINDWKKVFEQACINMHFANSSYVLTPTKKPSDTIMEHARNMGVGIYSCSDRKVTRVVPPHTKQGFVSYTSLLFNEWLGRHLFLRG